METVASGFALAEAPVWDGTGLYFSNVLGGGVYRVEPGGRPSVVIAKRNGVGGAALHADGRLIVTGRDVLCGDDVLVGHEPGLTGYNDCGTLADGTLLVGALTFHPFGGEDPQPGELIRVAPGGEHERLPLPNVRWPNGIACAPDGETFYIADYDSGVVWRNGAEEFARTDSGDADGVAVDSEGAVLVATGSGAGIARFTSDGALDRVIDVPATFVSSMCFAGEDLRDLYITTGDAVLRTRVEVPGLPVAPARV
jgi:gluconolactonase